ncbi:glycerophosphodiester phosphodiesterase family protein [Candidatus Chlorohelix sp.]|uniref:glycerophosphodiester phosphodiesterase n=1 Tax=Candidatus Chlorohelix sp. TaxID=3139201 RepID=UPI00306C5D96
MSTGLFKSKVCGHRGACGYAPENTFAAFHKALEQGAEWVEFDVQLSAEGVPIILHDDTLARTSDKGGARRPTELALSELKELDAGEWFGSEFAGERIPTLDELLEEFGQKLELNIEIKSKPNFEADNGIEKMVADAIVQHNLVNRVIVSSFDPTRLARLHAYNPTIPLGALYTSKAEEYPPTFDFFQLAEITGAIALHPHYKVIDEAYMGRARSLGLKVNTWTVNDPEDMTRLAKLGVDIIITNYPDKLVAALETIG